MPKKCRIGRVDMRIVNGKDDELLCTVIIHRSNGKARFHLVPIWKFKQVYAWLTENYEARVDTNVFWYGFEVQFIPKRSKAAEQLTIELATQTINDQTKQLEAKDRTINALYKERAMYKKALYTIYNMTKGKTFFAAVENIYEIVEEVLDESYTGE